MTDTNIQTLDGQTISSLPSLALRQHEATSVQLVAVASPGSWEQNCLIKILRLPEVIKRVGLKRASIYLHMAQGNFPKQISLGLRAVGWLESEIDAWLLARVQQTRGAPRS